LVIVGVLMAKQLGGIEWDRMEFAIPAFLTVIAMPLTYSISNGIALGLAFYPLAMIAKGRWREVHPIAYAPMAAFLAYFFFLVCSAGVTPCTSKRPRGRPRAAIGRVLC